MAEAPRFFLPESPPEDQEADYAELAAFHECPVPNATRRIYSITFMHDGEEWTATVGKQLHGYRYLATGSRAKRTERKQPLYDSASVLAIFDRGGPFIVVTNHGLVPGVRSKWANPFFASQSATVLHFSAAT